MEMDAMEERSVGHQTPIELGDEICLRERVM